MIMVGPGTGVVPFIGFLQERHITTQKSVSHLFFGCRRSDSDFIYQDDIVQYQAQGTLTKAHLAFSREENKEYVQDLMRRESAMIRQVIVEDKGHIYLCGSTKMGQDVQALLKEILGDDGFKIIEKEKRLIKELWG